MKTRILSGIIMAPLLALIYFGGYVLMAGCLLIGLVGVYEFFKGFKAMDIHPSYPIAAVSTLLLYAVGISGIVGCSAGRSNIYLLWIFVTVLMCLLFMFKIEGRKPADAMATLTGIMYVVFFSYHFTLVDQTECGILAWVIVLSAFGTDIFAYFTGVAFGRHKLCPKISPKKTIEGSIGGILGSVILCGLFGYFFANEIFIHCVILGALGGIVSQLGDLTASIFKRKMGIKDYGNLIPGHGGVLDRFDSVLFVAPLVYYYIQWVIG